MTVEFKRFKQIFDLARDVACNELRKFNADVAADDVVTDLTVKPVELALDAYQGHFLYELAAELYLVDDILLTKPCGVLSGQAAPPPTYASSAALFTSILPFFPAPVRMQGTLPCNAS